MPVTNTATTMAVPDLLYKGRLAGCEVFGNQDKPVDWDGKHWGPRGLRRGPCLPVADSRCGRESAPKQGPEAWVSYRKGRCQSSVGFP